jgi:hypothetical protein
MTSHRDPGTGLAPGLGQPQRVRFLTPRVNPFRPAQTQEPHSKLHPSTPRDQQEPRTVSPVNPTRHNPHPNPRTHPPATATAPNPAGPNTQETQHDSITDPATHTVTAPLTGRPPKPCSPPPRSRPAAYDDSPAAGPGRLLIDAGSHPNPAKAADGKRLYVLGIDEPAVAVVVRIFAEFLAGTGIYAIAERLTADQIACPSAHDRPPDPIQNGGEGRCCIERSGHPD